MTTLNVPQSKCSVSQPVSQAISWRHVSAGGAVVVVAVVVMVVVAVVVLVVVVVAVLVVVVVMAVVAVVDGDIPMQSAVMGTS